MIKQGHMLRDILFSGIVFLLFLTLLFFFISCYTKVVQKYQHNQSDKTLAVHNKSLLIPKIELHKVPEKVNQLLKDWNVTNVHVLTENEFEEKIQGIQTLRKNR